jgi:hypothetical protein
MPCNGLLIFAQSATNWPSDASSFGRACGALPAGFETGLPGRLCHGLCRPTPCWLMSGVTVTRIGRERGDRAGSRSQPAPSGGGPVRQVHQRPGERPSQAAARAQASRNRVVHLDDAVGAVGNDDEVRQS